jgi:penicillin-binding protein 1B
MNRRWVLPSTVAAAVAVMAFTFYVVFAFQQLQREFLQPEEFVPTRIYSDVTRIAPPAPRSKVLGRLRDLHYETSIHEADVKFKLRPVEYPEYLVPEGHPTLEYAGQEVTLQFEGKDASSPLQSIRIEGFEFPDLYLEPELVATLARTGSSGAAHIREILKFGDIPSPIWKAIIAVEDQHFLEHSGLDPRGLARAIWVNLKSLRLAQGGSTLTQQLVKNLMARRSKNIFKKFTELFLALLLEMRFGKEAILERYLNEVYLGQVGSMEVHGVAEGAKHFFGKRIEELNMGEIALMAGLIRGPGFYSPYRHMDRALERQRWVLNRMVETGQIAAAEAEGASKLPIRLAPPQSSANKAPYFTDFVKAELIRQLKDKLSETEISSAGFRVYSTLDPDMNEAAQAAVEAGVMELQTRFKLDESHRLEGALAAVDHSTGFIRALVGGRSYSASNFNRILNMQRQVGSTFKPLVYLTALLKGYDPQGVPYGPGHPIEDAPWKLTYDRGKQNWSPRNYENEFAGWVSFRQALALSINTAAARLGAEVGIEKVVETARLLGIDSTIPEVPAVTLGVAELSPVELLKVYATMANHGMQDELTVIRGITHDDGRAYARFVYHPKQVIDPAPADLITEMMTEVFQTGTAKVAKEWGFDRPAAGKTGTTSQYRDSWFAGYTPQLTAVVWTGFDQQPNAAEAKSEPIAKLTGAGSALPIWIRFMKRALAGEPAAAFPTSTYLKTVRIDKHTGQLASDGCPDDSVLLEKYMIDHVPEQETCETMFPASTLESNL